MTNRKNTLNIWNLRKNAFGFCPVFHNHEYTYILVEIKENLRVLFPKLEIKSFELANLDEQLQH